MFLITVIAVIIFATLVMIVNEKSGIEVVGSGRTPLGHFGSNVIYVITIIASQGNFILDFHRRRTCTLNKVAQAYVSPH